MRARFGARIVSFWMALLLAVPAVAQEPPAATDATPAPAAPSSIDPELVRQLQARIAALEEAERARAKVAPPAPAPTTNGIQLGAIFRDAFLLESSDGAFRLRVGGLI